MTRIGSPFAAQFLYEALDILGEPDAILASIRENYLPMIEAGATTVWETFPGSTCSPPGFPTRSHCHGWSCAPLLYFNRIILGIRPTAPGGRSYIIDPQPCGLTKASGAESTPYGPLLVAWEIRNGRLLPTVQAPPEIRWTFAKNPSFQN
jgi:hypothetical protein